MSTWSPFAPHHCKHHGDTVACSSSDNLPFRNLVGPSHGIESGQCRQDHLCLTLSYRACEPSLYPSLAAWPREICWTSLSQSQVREGVMGLICPHFFCLIIKAIRVNDILLPFSLSFPIPQVYTRWMRTQRITSIPPLKLIFRILPLSSLTLKTVNSENLLGGGRRDWILPMHFLSDIFYCMPGGHLLYLEIIKLAFSLLLLIALWINYSLATGDDGSASHHWARGGYETVALFLNHSITVFRVFFFFSWTQLVHSHASQLREYLESS